MTFLILPGWYLLTSGLLGLAIGFAKFSNVYGGNTDRLENRLFHKIFNNAIAYNTRYRGVVDAYIPEQSAEDGPKRQWQRSRSSRHPLRRPTRSRVSIPSCVVVPVYLTVA